MVYRGKLSKACEHCRKRKLRCDLRKSSCGQCLRASLSCSGYRETEEIRFLDESQKTKLRALTRHSKEIPQSLVVCLDDKARAAFFAQYVIGVAKAFDVLQSLYERSRLHGHFVASIDAVSLAYFAFHFHAPPALQQAKERYVEALPLLNAALQDPGASRSDESLAAVLLLDLFEKIVNRNPRTRESWMSHVNGALALVRLRDRAVFHKYIDLRLSARLYINLLISCVAADAPVPPALGKLRSDLEPFLNKDDPKWQLTGLVSEYANLRQILKADSVEWPDALARVAKLDSDYVLLVKRMPLVWLYQRIYDEDSPGKLLEDHFDTYADLHVTQTWNVLRVMRILMNATVCVYYSTRMDLPDAESSMSMAIDNMDALVKDICASAPQYTTHINLLSEGAKQFELRKVQCHTLLFPLYVAAMYASPVTRVAPWVMNHLRFMSSEMGIQNAVIVSEILESGNLVEPWKVYAKLGSYAFAT